MLRKCGVRFGFYHIFMPALLKPAPARLLALLSLVEDNLRRVQRDEKPRLVGESLAQLPAAGLTSAPTGRLPGWLYRAAGFYTGRARLIRFDMLERLADIIRPLLSENKQGFEANEAMMSIMGCSGEELAEILTALGYRAHEVAAPPETQTETPAETQTETPAEPPAEKAEETEEVKEVAAPEAETSEAETPEAEAPETAMRVLWRPAPRSHNDRAKGAANSKNNKGKKRGAGRKSTQARPQKNNARYAANGPKGHQRAEKKPDPLSPFAVLKQLQAGQNTTPNDNAKKRDEA
jgi:ATP-dependent RNA helicase SUPV3L1/SUV3